jgi:outer membrane protein assembly factor BamB
MSKAMIRWTMFGCVVVTVTAAFGDWRGFRGTESSAAATTSAPTKWSDTENIAWKIDLPGRGLSSPILVGDRVFLTASSGGRQDRLHVLSFDKATGEQIWERQFWATGRTISHPTTCNAAPTPVSDGERIYAFYSSNDLVCIDLDGNLQWFRGLTHDYPNVSNSLGMASSLIVADGVVIAMAENDTDSLTTGVDCLTGVELWKLERPRKANWTSPVHWKGKKPGEDLVLIQSSAGVHAIVPRTGETKWSYDDGASTVASLVVGDGVAYVPSHGVTAIRPGESTPSVAEILWQEGGLNPGTSSLAVHKGKVYFISDSGVLSCADAKTGKREYQARLPKGHCSGSPIIAGDYLYVFNELGMGIVCDLNDKGKVVSEHNFDQTILCTAAIADGAIYVRSDKTLWKIAQP